MVDTGDCLALVVRTLSLFERLSIQPDLAMVYVCLLKHSGAFHHSQTEGFARGSMRDALTQSFLALDTLLEDPAYQAELFAMRQVCRGRVNLACAI
jgi:hypothetical protein